MSLTASIRAKLLTAFAPEHFELENESHQHAVPSQSETHFKLVMVSPAFEGVSRVDRQRRVTDLLGDERARGLHALTMRLLTPGEWAKVKDSFVMESPACHGGSKREKRN